MRKQVKMHEPSARPGRRIRRAVISLSIALGLFASWSMLAHSGALDPLFKQKGKRNGTISTQAFNSNSPSKEYVYAGGRLVATEEPTASCGNPPSAPSNLSATADSTTTVNITWSPSSGADHYEIQRRENITAPWANLSPNPSGTSFPDVVSSNRCYLYRVRAVDASGLCPSAYGNVDLATTVAFTDSELQGELIKAQHVIELRQAINLVRAAANIGAATWTNPLDQVRAIHFSELRTRLNEALTLLEVNQVSLDSEISLNSVVKAVHLQAVRGKVK